MFLTVVAALWPARAEAGPSRAARETSRDGWILGLVFGSASSDVTVQDRGLSASSGWIGGGRVMRGRVGWFARRNLLITGEYGVWRRADASADTLAAEEEGTASSPGWTGPTDRYLGAGALSAHLYPLDDVGFSLKAGLGYGRVAATVVQDGVSLAQDGWGFMLLMGAAWEWSIAHDISIGLGADVGRIDGGSAVSGNFAHFTAAFQLHLPAGVPRNWF